MQIDSTKEPGMSSPATYQITVKGKLDEQWAEWFNGTIINLEHSFQACTHTILTCQVRDQAELYGILNRLTSFNLVLLKVTLHNKKGEIHVEKPQ